jgi:hypothetical protein
MPIRTVTVVDALRAVDALDHVWTRIPGIGIGWKTTGCG